MAKALELAIVKLAGVSRDQDAWFGRELRTQVHAMSRLRADIEVGLRELDPARGRERDREDLLQQGRFE